MLRLPWQSKLTQQPPQGLVELYMAELETETECVENCQDLLVVASEIFSQCCLVNPLHLDDVTRNSLGSVFVDESLGHIIGNGQLGLLVKHQNEVLNLLSVLLVHADVV